MRNRYIEGLNYELPHPFRAEAERLAVSFDTDTVKVDGIIYWKSNGNVPPTDILDFWRHIGKRFNYNKSIAMQKRQTKVALERYRANQRPLTWEERAEMEATFGKGAEVVDVITGRRTKL